MSDWKEGRGRGLFYSKSKNGEVFTIMDGNPDIMGFEAEHIISIHKDHVDVIIATLRMMQGERNG